MSRVVTFFSEEFGDEGIVNRLYYAAFHAAQAVLYDRDVAPSSHGAIRNRLGSILQPVILLDRVLPDRRIGMAPRHQ